MARRIILDVDTGSDDAVAIMLAGLHPSMDLTACTTVWGNLDVGRTTGNTLSVLEHIGRGDVPVYKGLAQPYAPVLYSAADNPKDELEIIHAIHLPKAAGRERHGGAVEYLVEILRGTTERITLVPVAPLSNIAAAITADPGIVDAVDEIIIMGGGHAVGNVTPSAEANIWHDPIAADVVFSAGFERLVLVPLDATHEAVVSRAQCDRLAAHGTPAAEFAAQLISQRLHKADGGEPGLANDTATLHDALCIAYLIDPAVVTLTHCHVVIETFGRYTVGRTVLDVSGSGGGAPNAWVALSADAGRFFGILETTLSGATDAPKET
jgi:purine nucleosidase/ribosylpyrimidine nucleosidase